MFMKRFISDFILNIMKKDYVYQHTFTVSEAQLAHVHVELVCEGLDTLAHVSLNGREIAFADNMHITWVWDVKEQLHAGENTLDLCHFMQLLQMLFLLLR